MKSNDYANLHVDEVVRRLRLMRGNDVIRPVDVVPLLLRYAVVIPLYKTSLSDPIDAVVELIDKIIPTAPVAELERRLRDGDGVAAHDLSILYMFGLRGVKHDCSLATSYTTYIMEHPASSEYDYRLYANAFEYLRTKLYGCPCKMDTGVEQMKFNVVPNDMFRVFMSMLCSRDYTCPLTLLEAVEFQRWSVNSSIEIEEFLERHPEAYRYYRRSVSVRCNNDGCSDKYCNAGVITPCVVCGMPYCSVQCRDDDHDVHARVCRRELRPVISRIFISKASSCPKS